MTFQPCFSAVEMKERMTAKSVAPTMQRKPPEIFCLTFIMRASRSALAADAKAGLVHVLDRCAGHEVAHRDDEVLQAGGASPAHPGDGRGGQLDAEQVGHQLGQM